MRLTITIDCDNDAFCDDHSGTEAARILRHVAQQIDGSDLAEGEGALYDINGNRVGEAVVTY